MTPKQFETAIDKLGMTQNGAGRFLGRDARTIRRIITGDLDLKDDTAMLIALMVHHGSDPDDVRKLAGLKPVEYGDTRPDNFKGKSAS